MINLLNGNCLDLMRSMPDNSVDSIVTDPPYGLNFMGKKWDCSVPSVEIWAECLRVLKPGGHLLAFAGTRTQHRMAVNIEDAGFEIRDMIAWVYGSGFPKSMDVSKAIDKAAGVAFDSVPASGVGFMSAEGAGGYNVTKNQLVRSGESCDAARQWQGWGTALKPALEPITVARKPLIGTVAANVLEHGTGALNIDGCRVGEFHNVTPSGVDRRNAALAEAGYRPSTYQMGEKAPNTPPGRWPANLIHDGSDEVLAGFPQSSTTGRRSQKSQNSTVSGTNWLSNNHKSTEHTDKGSAARFFYCAKANNADRESGLEGFELKESGFKNDSGRGTGGSDPYKKIMRSNTHPTVKPIDLMRYLCRLVTPPKGIVLDPFMGSGSTGKAAVLEGFSFVGMELDADYFKIAQARVSSSNQSDSGQCGLFDGMQP